MSKNDKKYTQKPLGMSNGINLEGWGWVLGAMQNP
jgi:hypothetical protein